MFRYQNFEDVFSFNTGCTYADAAILAIESHRQSLEGLFVDKVLKLIGIKRPVKVYPPKSNGDLRSLHKAIVDGNGADHTKITLLYYLLLDFDAPTGREDYSRRFEESSFLPQKYQTYMKGLWHLDRADFELALQYLTHPTLIPTFADEILEVLVRNMDPNDPAWPLAYYQTVQPSLTSASAIEKLFSAIARSSVTEAFYFSRGQPEYARRRMLGLLIELVLRNSSDKTGADRSVELINLPMTQEEEGWFEDYLLRGEGRSIRKGKDALMMRRIGTGNFVESIALQGMNNRTIDGLNWITLSDAVQEGLGPR